MDVTIDQYPYTASATGFEAGFVPQWVQEGGRMNMLARLYDPTTAARVRIEIANLIENDRGGGDPANVMLTACDFDSTLAGKNLARILRARQKPVSFRAAADLVIDIV